jgi:hypothetical protein
VTGLKNWERNILKEVLKDQNSKYKVEDSSDEEGGSQLKKQEPVNPPAAAPTGAKK